MVDVKQVIKGVCGALFGLSIAAAAQAADNVTVTVNATVTGVCKFFTSAPVLNINNTGTGSNIDPSLAGPATGNVAISYRCATGQTPSFTVPATATVTCGACSGTPTLTPSITSANTGAGTGMGSGQNKTLTLTGTLLQAAYENAAIGAYTGTIVVSVSP